MRCPNRLAACSVAVVLWGSLAGSLFADPTVTNLSLRGLRIDGTTTLVIDGRDLLPAPVLIGSFPIGKQTVKPDPKPNRVEIEIEIPANAVPGIHQVRIATEKGVSNPVAVGLDRLPQLPFTSDIVETPVALHGSLTGTQILSTRFRGKQGERFVADIEAQRLGGRLKPILRVKDSAGRQVGWSPMQNAIGGDARVELTLPADGEYSVEIHDMLFRGAAPGFFRLKLGQLAFADLAYPLAVPAGSKQSVQFARSSLPPTASGEVDAASASFPALVAATVPEPLFTGSSPRVAISPHAELVETPTADGSRQVLAEIPIAVSGRLAAKNEEDQYAVPVKPGMKLRVHVTAQEFGSPLDGVLTVRNEAGNQLATNDDRPGEADPGVEVQVPGDAKQLIVSLRDLLRRGGPEFVYRIEITDAAAPDFSVTVDADRLNVPSGGTQIWKVQAERRNYNGPIKLEFPGLPTGLQVAGNEIPAGATLGLVSLTASGEPVHGLVRGQASAAAENVKVTRPIRGPELPASETAPWFRNELAVAVTKPLPVQIAWSEPVEAPLLLGEKMPLTVNLTRAGGPPRTVRFRLLTTQVMPRKTIKENNRDKEVDDVDRALRLEGEPTAGPDAKQATVNVLVPADLPAQDWGLAIAAEILNPEGKAVIATSTTTVLVKRPVAPFALELAATESVEAKAGMGDTGKLVGKIRRQAGFAKPVVLRVEGLPKEYEALTTTVPGDKEDFEFPIRFSYGAKPAELKDVKVVAQYQPDPQKADLVIRSAPADVKLIKVVPGEPPPPGQLLAIFEDDEKFLGYLSKGGGQITLETSEKFAGAAAAKVTPDQRYNEMVPNLNVKIREKPGPGEYRYLRFAWKKKGGATICLQLNHDGAWGPGGSGKEGAKFRYHAGPGGECYGASVVLDEKLPSDFVVVTRDLFADFGEFTLTGIAFSPVDGEYALFDHLHLAQSAGDFEQLKSGK